MRPSTSKGCLLGPQSILLGHWCLGWPIAMYTFLDMAVTSTPVSILKTASFPLTVT